MDRYLNLYILLRIFIMVLAPLSLNIPLHAQKFTDPESGYSVLRSLAFDGNLAEAEQEAIILLDDFPEYGDAWILLARIYGWQQKYEAASEILDSIIINDSKNMDALKARLDLACWRGENSLAVDIANRILASDPDDDEALRNKQRAIKAMEENDISETVMINPSDSISDYGTALIKTDVEEPRNTDLRAGYYFDSFSEPYSRFWQVLKLGAAHDMPFGKILAGINAGNLQAEAEPAINTTELQFEAEAYPRISKNAYAWLGYAYSPGKYFPSHRISAEFWHKLPNSWVVSTGVHYYYFDRNIFIMSFSGEKYYHSYWFSSKIYFYLKDQGTTTSLYLNARKYLNETDYFQLTAGTGTAPDEPFDIEIALERLSATTVRLAYFTSLTNIISIRAGVGYSYEEFAESMHRNRYDGSISLIYSINKRK